MLGACREASQELAAQAARDRDERRRGDDRRGGGGMGPPPQRPGYDRMLDKSDIPSRGLQVGRGSVGW